MQLLSPSFLDTLTASKYKCPKLTPISSCFPSTDHDPRSCSAYSNKLCLRSKQHFSMANFQSQHDYPTIWGYTIHETQIQSDRVESPPAAIRDEPPFSFSFCRNTGTPASRESRESLETRTSSYLRRPCA